METVDIFILAALVISALTTVTTRSLLRAALSLALTSAIVTLVLFRMAAPLAGAFEISVCAGLIPVIFITVISITKPLTKEQSEAFKNEKWNKFWMLPVIVAVAAIFLFVMPPALKFPKVQQELQTDTKQIIWGERQMDLVGQVAILLAGALGILILFKEKKK
jgi:NADH-quinone oxidoreductase subunit J